MFCVAVLSFRHHSLQEIPVKRALLKLTRLWLQRRRRNREVLSTVFGSSRPDDKAVLDLVREYREWTGVSVRFMTGLAERGPTLLAKATKRRKAAELLVQDSTLYPLATDVVTALVEQSFRLLAEVTAIRGLWQDAVQRLLTTPVWESYSWEKEERGAQGKTSIFESLYGEVSGSDSVLLFRRLLFRGFVEEG